MRFLPELQLSKSETFEDKLGKGDQLMTRDVCTRWYKAPEMLFGSVTYSLGASDLSKVPGFYRQESSRIYLSIYIYVSVSISSVFIWFIIFSAAKSSCTLRV